MSFLLFSILPCVLLICQKIYLPPLFYRINSCRVLVSFKTIRRCCWFLNYYAKKKSYRTRFNFFNRCFTQQTQRNVAIYHSSSYYYVVLTLTGRRRMNIVVCCLLFLHCDFVCFDFILYCVFFCFYFILKSATSTTY